MWKTKVVVLFHCESSNACQLLAPLVETRTKKINSFNIIIGFFFISTLFLAAKVAISLVYYSPRTIKCTQKPKIEKKVYRNRPIERASECHSPLGLGVFENPPEPDTKLRNSKECCVPTGSQVHAKATTFSENNGKRRR